MSSYPERDPTSSLHIWHSVTLFVCLRKQAHSHYDHSITVTGGVLITHANITTTTGCMS